MNQRQKNLIDKVTKGKEKEFLSEFLEHFLDKGLGSLNKSETDIFIFHLLDKFQNENGLSLSNYEWSSLLKISERKIKNLRLQVGIRYASDNEEDEFHLWLRLLELISEGYIEFDGKDKVIVTIENPYLLRFIEHQLKTLKLPTTDYGFNKERVKLKTTSLEKLLATAAEEIKLGKGNTKAEAKLKAIKWDLFKKEKKKQVFELLQRSLPSLMKNIVMPTGG